MMRKISKKNRMLTAGFSLVAVFIIVLFFFAVLPYLAFQLVNELLFVSILIATFPSAILEYQNQKWVDAIEDQMPTLVKGVSESQETGLTITKALEKVVEDKMIDHPLSDEVSKITVNMSWGMSFEGALTKFKERIGSSGVSRFCALVLEASRSGGQIRKVFSATSGFMEEMRQMDDDSSSQMRPYIIIIYAAFLVFLFTAVILVQSFFTPLQGSQQILSQAPIGTTAQFKDFFYKNMLISALTGGLMAGKIGERRVAAGLKHSMILSVMGYAIFFFAIPPNWMH
jgi:flagellar protein FlaJ